VFEPWEKSLKGTTVGLLFARKFCRLVLWFGFCYQRDFATYLSGNIFDVICRFLLYNFSTQERF